MHVMKFHLISTFPACKVLLIFPHISLLFYVDNVSPNLISILLFKTKVTKRNIQRRLVSRVISTEKGNRNPTPAQEFFNSIST